MKKVIALVMMLALLAYPANNGKSSVNNLENEYNITSEELETFELINEERNKNNIEDLNIDYELENIARLKAKDMVENEYFSHTSPDYGDIEDMLDSFGIEYISVKENIAGNTTAKKAIEEWMNSTNHRINILNKEFTSTGVAVINSLKYGKIYVQIFAK